MVEASGVADPGAIVVLGDLPGYRRDAAVVVADAETVRARAADDATGHQIRGQLRAADLLVLNKTDLVDAERARPDARMAARDRGAVDGDRRDLVRRGAGGRRARRARAPAGRAPADAHADARRKHDHEHDHATHPSFETWSWSGAAPMSGAGLVEALKALPDGIVRAKGLLHLREDPPAATSCSSSGGASASRPTGLGRGAPASQLVVIGLPGSVDAHALDATLARLQPPAQRGTGARAHGV